LLDRRISLPAARIIPNSKHPASPAQAAASAA